MPQSQIDLITQTVERLRSQYYRQKLVEQKKILSGLKILECQTLDMTTYLKIATNTFASHLKSENVEMKIRYVLMHFKTIFNIKVDFESTFENSHYLHVDIVKIE